MIKVLELFQLFSIEAMIGGEDEDYEDVLVNPFMIEEEGDDDLKINV